MSSSLKWIIFSIVRLEFCNLFRRNVSASSLWGLCPRPIQGLCPVPLDPTGDFCPSDHVARTSGHTTWPHATLAPIGAVTAVVLCRTARFCISYCTNVRCSQPTLGVVILPCHPEAGLVQYNIHCITDKKYQSVTHWKSVSNKRIFKFISLCKDEWEFVGRSKSISNNGVMHVRK